MLFIFFVEIQVGNFKSLQSSQRDFTTTNNPNRDFTTARNSLRVFITTKKDSTTTNLKVSTMKTVSTTTDSTTNLRSNPRDSTTMNKVHL